MQIAKHLHQSTMPNLLPNKSKKIKIPKTKVSNKPTLLQRQKLQQQQQQQKQQQQQQQQQVFQNKVSSFTGENHSSLASSGDISVLPHGSSAYSDKILQDNYIKQHSYESQSSNWDPNRFSSPASSSFSQNDIISEVDDFMGEDLTHFLNENRSLNINLTTEEMQEEINQIEQCLNLPKTVRFLIFYMGENAK